MASSRRAYIYQDPMTSSTIPTHATNHENGGSDEINVAGLSGLLADPQTPTAHASTHENGGSDEINVDGLSGLLADAQTPRAHQASHTNGGVDELTVENLGTVSLTTTHVLSPDGAGGLQMRAESVGTDLTGLGTDNRIARWNGVDTLQNSAIVIDDTTGLMHGVDHTGRGGGELRLWDGSTSGDVDITGGTATSSNETGGTISLTGGTPDGTGEGGSVVVSTNNEGIFRFAAGGMALGPVTALGTLAASINDWSPTGWPDHIVYTATGAGGGTTITGLVAPSTTSRTQIMVLINTGSGNITLSDNSGSSTAGNRFQLTGSTIRIAAGQVAIFIYQGSDWYVLT